MCLKFSAKLPAHLDVHVARDERRADGGCARGVWIIRGKLSIQVSRRVVLAP